MKKYRVLHTIRQGKIGGGETYLLNLVSNLDREKYEPVVLSFTDGPMIDRLKNEGIQTHIIETEKPFSVHLYSKVVELISKEKIDLLHVHGTRAGTNSLIPAKMKKIPSIYTVHGWSFHTGNNSLITFLREKAEMLITKLSNVTVCGSEADLQTGIEKCSVKNHTLIHNSIDTEYFTKETVQTDLRNELGYSNDDYVISFIGRITFQKDPLTFIKAIPGVVKRIPNAKFLIIGDGELKESCQKLSVELGIDNFIKYLPFSNDVRSVLKVVDVFVLPSLWEVIPLALLEAMAMEKLCVATNIPGTTEALTDNVNGYLFKPGDYKKLAEKLIDSFTKKAFANRLKMNARETVVEKFDLKLLVKRNEELYKSILENKKYV